LSDDNQALYSHLICGSDSCQNSGPVPWLAHSLKTVARVSILTAQSSCVHCQVSQWLARAGYRSAGFDLGRTREWWEAG